MSTRSLIVIISYNAIMEIVRAHIIFTPSRYHLRVMLLASHSPVLQKNGQ